MSFTPSRSPASSPAFACAVGLSHANALLGRTLSRTVAPWEINWPQALSLLALAEMPSPITATHLVERLGLGRTAMTSVVDRLQRRGWVERRPLASDRRGAEIFLTEPGRRMLDEVLPVLADAIVRSFADVPDLTELRDGLLRIIAALGADSATDADSDE